MTAQSQPKSRQPRNKSKFKRFRNAFIFYVNDQRSKVDEETKKLKNRPFLQLMSARWKSMTESERSPYVKQAERDKERFNDDVKKYGKYESRQRRYNKARSASREIPGQQGSMFGLSVGGGGVPPYQNTTGAANILYDDGYGNAMHQSQVQAQALAQAQIQHAHRQAQADAAAAFPSFYVGYTHGDPQANAVATASYPPPDLRHGGVANGTGAVPAIMTQSVQQGGLLCLPELATHRTSLSSSASSNELGDLRQSPLGHVFPWLTASDRLSAGNKVVGAGKPYPFYQNQPATPGGTFMQQVPAAIPIAHSLTEPMLYGGDAHSAQPQIPLAVQAQIPQFMDAQNKAAKRWEIPRQRAFAIEYPGYVRDVNKAVLTLGGHEQLARSMVNDKDDDLPVELRFRYDDPTSHPISGEKVATQNLLLKVTKCTRRPKNKALGGAQASAVAVVSESAKVVAVIDKTVRFRKLADFQCIVPKGDPLTQFARVLRSVDIDEAKKLCESGVLDTGLTAATGYIPAPFLDRLCWPSQYPLKDSADASRATRDQHMEGVEESKPSNSQTDNKFNAIVITFSSLAVPTGPTPAAQKAIEKIPPELLKKAQDILAETPVVSRNSMDVLIPPSELNGCKMVTIMTTMAYLMEKSPWRSCWIRFGYDPRKEEDAYKYQVLDMRRLAKSEPSGRVRINRRGVQLPMRVQQQQQEETAARNIVKAQHYLFDESAARQGIAGIFQFHHVRVPLIQNLIEYPGGRRKRPCEKSGWLQPSLAQEIRFKARAFKRKYEDPERAGDGSLDIDYDALDKNIAADRRAEEAELEVEERLRVRGMGSTLGQASQAILESVDAHVDRLMESLGSMGGTGISAADSLGNYGDDSSEFEVYGEESDDLESD
ncbi:tau 95 subunit of transcription factor TFIIIC [Coemansia sp. RSA 2320]|nr:tau 95 subunit of transcription factor TFIIIC [Coemansia sp. RSA 2320]